MKSKVSIKPLSVNEVWQGRRFKTPAYNDYESELFVLLPRHLILPKGLMHLKIKWGFWSRAGDIDNPIKPFLDVLQKMYGFNDNRIMKLEVEKGFVKKGDYYIEFEFLDYIQGVDN